MHPPKIPKQVCAFLELMGYYRKCIRNFAKIAKPLTLLTHQQAKFEWTPTHHNAFLMLKESVIQAHNGTEFLIFFLLHTFMDTQCKWSTTEQEAYGVYNAVMKWNYYLQGAEVIVCNDHKPLARFCNEKNANNKLNRWGLELATYNINFKWISRTCNKASDCLS